MLIVHRAGAKHRLDKCSTTEPYCLVAQFISVLSVFSVLFNMYLHSTYYSVLLCQTTPANPGVPLGPCEYQDNESVCAHLQVSPREQPQTV